MSNLDDLEKRALDLDDEDADPWKPSIGDVISGRVVEIDLRATDFDANVPVLTLETLEGLRTAWIFHTVLRGELRKKNVRVGDEIAIRRLENSAKGYMRYRVLKSNDDAEEFDWSRVPIRGGDVPPEDLTALLLRNQDKGTPPQKAHDKRVMDSGPNGDLPF